jgi:hypothetical protein
MLELAKQIVEEYEKNLTCLYEVRQYEDELEDTMLYLAAKAYLKRYE